MKILPERMPARGAEREQLALHGLAPPPPLWRLYWRRLKRYPLALAGSAVFAFFLLMACVGPWVAPYEYQAQEISRRLAPPSWEHLCGTDQYGRDVFSRILAGSRGIFILGGSGTLLAGLLGISIGLFAGYAGGLWDEFLMRILDIFLAFPPLLLALVILATIGPSLASLVLVVAILYVPMLARVARSMVLDLMTKEFVEAAVTRGESRWYILFQEILPNATAPLLVELAMRFSYAIFLVASLGFLGMGVQPPSPDWGLQINEARSFFSRAPWMLLFPALAISLLVVATNLMTDGLRLALDPKGGGR
jgi:peptide/nickel transport system permease protein